MEVWHLWLIAAVGLFAIEIFSSTFVFLCFSIGCVFGALATLFTDSITIQMAVFGVASVVLFFTVKPMAEKFLSRRTDNKKLNVDALVGQCGRVSETIDEDAGTGRVDVYGDNWKALSDDGSVIPQGTRVEVLRVDSTIIYVRKIINH